jgi:stearoyl-CoA desaturase (delta-9 desaturase)
MFRHSAWMSNVAYYIGMVVFVYTCLYSPSYLWAVFSLYLVASITISVGYHRLFCHGAFETSSFWHTFFALAGVLFMYSSPLQWAVTHATHHRHSDTDLDPHEKPLQLISLFRKGYRNVPLRTILARRLLRERLHLLVDRYYVVVWFLLAGAILAISPTFFLFAYLPALGLGHLVGAFHNTLSHIGNKANDWWFMEFILPAAGEWHHGYHHKHWRAWNFASKPYHFDMGAWVVRAIRK